LSATGLAHFSPQSRGGEISQRKDKEGISESPVSVSTPNSSSRRKGGGGKKNKKSTNVGGKERGNLLADRLAPGRPETRGGGGVTTHAEEEMKKQSRTLNEGLDAAKPFSRKERGAKACNRKAEARD